MEHTFPLRTSAGHLHLHPARGLLLGSLLVEEETNNPRNDREQREKDVPNPRQTSLSEADKPRKKFHLVLFLW